MENDKRSGLSEILEGDEELQAFAEVMDGMQVLLLLAEEEGREGDVANIQAAAVVLWEHTEAGKRLAELEFGYWEDIISAVELQDDRTLEDI